ncbi:sensor histidine kinase [Sanguibacter antarcticus]|uniref:histidine kinase n=1 Tax=Sanguibacter antarcticus TaxID=372484 RepID=A0A2A9E2G7_9MICO|nr:HAMP domain-containing sensor histidine kinase [Sanguibacter antarcticus]PFG32402.1 histidine kinase [Sanguibacter antarcticus]
MMIRSRPPASALRGLAPRLLVAIMLVLATGAVTAWVVASIIGPALFHDHMVRAQLSDPDMAVLHAEEAFRSASTLTLTFALAAAGLASMMVSILLARRISRSLAAFSSTAADVGMGLYASRISPPGIGTEFDTVAASFNQMAERLQDSERLRGRLMADVAHEVRTPVATISAYLEALEDGIQTLDEATTAVLREQAARLTRLSLDLSAVTRAESGDLTLERAPVDPRDLVAAALSAGREPAAAQSVHLVSDVDEDLPQIHVDRLRMAQILDNLVANAIRHTPPGGIVTVHASRAPAGCIRFSVRDTGEGIAPEHLPHLFERFYRADTARDRAHGGSGIGLAISQALTAAHGGRITAASAGPGTGSEFSFTLPGGQSRLIDSP